jgi:hypothetical protein
VVIQGEVPSNYEAEKVVIRVEPSELPSRPLISTWEWRGQLSFLCLPHDVVKYLCSFLDCVSILRFARVCKYVWSDALTVARARAVRLFGPNGCCMALHVFGLALEKLNTRVVINARPVVKKVAVQTTLSFGAGKLNLDKPELEYGEQSLEQEDAYQRFLACESFLFAQGLEPNFSTCYADDRLLARCIRDVIEKYGSFIGLRAHRERRFEAREARDQEAILVRETFLDRRKALRDFLVEKQAFSRDEDLSNVTLDRVCGLALKRTTRCIQFAALLPFSFQMNNLLLPNEDELVPMISFLKGEKCIFVDAVFHFLVADSFFCADGVPDFARIRSKFAHCFSPVFLAMEPLEIPRDERRRKEIRSCLEAMKLNNWKAFFGRRQDALSILRHVINPVEISLPSSPKTGLIWQTDPDSGLFVKCFRFDLPSEDIVTNWRVRSQSGLSNVLPGLDLRACRPVCGVADNIKYEVTHFVAEDVAVGLSNHWPKCCFFFLPNKDADFPLFIFERHLREQDPVPDRDWSVLNVCPPQLANITHVGVDVIFSKHPLNVNRGVVSSREGPITFLRLLYRAYELLKRLETLPLPNVPFVWSCALHENEDRVWVEFGIDSSVVPYLISFAGSV